MDCDIYLGDDVYKRNGFLGNARNEFMVDEIARLTGASLARHVRLQRAGRYEFESLTEALAAQKSGLTLTVYCDFVMEWVGTLDKVN